MSGRNKGNINENIYKIVLIGDSSVGKSNILRRFKKATFITESKATIGVEFSTKKMVVDGQTVSVQLWDTGGQEKFRAITKLYYRGAVGAVLVYDITQQFTFVSVQKWLAEIKESADSPNIIIMLLGNKVDKEDERQVNKEEAIQFAEANKLGFLETSAKTGQNIDYAFKKIVEEILISAQINIQQELIVSEYSDEYDEKERGIELKNNKNANIQKNSSSCC